VIQEKNHSAKEFRSIEAVGILADITNSIHTPFLEAIAQADE